MLKIITTALLLLVTVCSFGQTIRSKENINKGWQYLEVNTNTPKQALVETSWNAVDLPHTWNAFDVTDQDPGYRRSASWYRKNITITDLSATQHYELYFEGANITTCLLYTSPSPRD